MSATNYTTIQGDRWDTIAYKAYGDASLVQPIIAANPYIPVSAYFDGGVTLSIPIIEQSSSTDKSLLPPWKRVTSTGESQAAATAPLFLNIATSQSGQPAKIIDQNSAVVAIVPPGGSYEVLSFDTIGGGGASTTYTVKVISA